MSQETFRHFLKSLSKNQQNIQNERGGINGFLNNIKKNLQYWRKQASLMMVASRNDTDDDDDDDKDEGGGALR